MELGHFSREMHASICENHVIEQCFIDRGIKKGVMIDVGAHFGGSMLRFLRRGWDVYAYEPDNKNRSRMQKRLKNEKNRPKVIDTRAVCDKAGQKLSFYSSKESAGISSLSPFHETHETSGIVTTTTISELVKENNIEKIDYLKIDVEGFDFHVLKGVQWNKIKPEIILCEFEDEKSKKLGYVWTEMADYLEEKGYTVYVSEWHPIIRYGIPHDWRCIKKYPCKLDNVNAWGNLVAFQSDPGMDMINETVKRVLKVNNNKNDRKNKQTLVKNDRKKDNSHLSTIGRFAEWIKEKNLTIFQIGQFVMWGMRSIWKHYMESLIILCVLSLLIFMPFLIKELSHYKGYLLSAAAIAAMCIIGAMAVSFVNMKTTKQIEIENKNRRVLRRELRHEYLTGQQIIDERLDVQEAQLKQIIESLENNINMQYRIDKDLGGLRAMFDEFKKICNPVISKSSLFNFNDFQSFNRRLKSEHVDLLRKKWRKKLDLNIKPKGLAYLAHRICLLESNSKGRLATSIEDAVLRVLVAGSIKKNNINILEIGTLFGIGLIAIHDFVSSRYEYVHLTAIDPLEGYYEKDKRDIVTDEKIDESNFSMNLLSAGVPEKDFTLIKAFSTDKEALEKVAKKSKYDVLIIDGDHTLKGVADDFNNYLPFVHTGGLIVFDDYSANEWPDVKTFVDNCLIDNPNVELVGTSWNTAVLRVVAKDNKDQTKKHFKPKDKH